MKDMIHEICPKMIREHVSDDYLKELEKMRMSGATDEMMEGFLKDVIRKLQLSDAPTVFLE